MRTYTRLVTGRSSYDDAPHILRALTRIRTATGLPLTFGGPVNALQQVRLSEFSGTNNGAMRGVLLDLGLGLGGKAVALRRPIVVNDYVDSSGISHHYDRFIRAENLRAMVAAPVVVRRAVRGVLYGSLRCDSPLGDRVVHSIVEAARDLEQTLAIQDELNRRMDWLDEQALSNQPGQTSTPQWELVRESYTELRVLLQQIDDAALRQRVDHVCAKLAAACVDESRAPATPRLTAREVDVLACIALGWTNTHVAADLGLNPETVKSYLRSAMRKLRCHSRLEAVVAARRYGLLP